MQVLASETCYLRVKQSQIKAGLKKRESCYETAEKRAFIVKLGVLAKPLFAQRVRFTFEEVGRTALNVAANQPFI